MTAPKRSGSWSDLEQVIVGLTRGRIAMAPVTIADLAIEVDYRLRYAVGRAELDAAIRRLVAAGAVKETPGWGLIDGRSRRGRRLHPPLTEAGFQHFAACRDPIVWPNNPAARITIPSRGASLDSTEWRRAESLAYAIRDALYAKGLATTVVAIVEAPQALSFDVLAEADRDPTRVCRLAEVVARAHGFADARVSPLRQLP